MKKSYILFVLIAWLLSACAGKPASSADPAVPQATPVVPAYLLLADPVIVHSASYTIIAKDPARALTAVQQAVEQAGGFVSSASAYASNGSSSYASLSAKVPPEAFAKLNGALTRIADQVQSQSLNVQDVTAEVHKLQQRHADLTQARTELFTFLLNSRDLDRFSTFGILQELLDTELKAVASQLENYAGQANLGSLDVTIQQPATVAPPAIE